MTGQRRGSGGIMGENNIIINEVEKRECFKSYENFIRYLDENKLEETLDEVLHLQYKILFRRWDELEKNIDKKLHVKQPKLLGDDIVWEDSQFIVEDFLKWNAGYFNKSIKYNDINEETEKGYYTDFIDEENRKSIFEVFFPRTQPMLDVKYYDVQERAASILRNEDKPNFHLIFDEVGTGKTVSALYCVRDIVEEKNKESKILILCPNNKKEEGQKDIKRQLGLYSYIVKNDNLDSVYNNDIKSIYFKENEPAIFIEGQKKDEKKESLDRWNVSEKWDLIIIDEGHQCFDNYDSLKGNKALLLTATPIVINSTTEYDIAEIKNIRKPNDYVNKLCKITGRENYCNLENLFFEKDIFTQLFREDLKIEPKTRNIIFRKCQRLKDREDYLDVLTDVKGSMTRLLYEQDDEMLMYGIFHRFKEDIEKEGYLIGKENEIENYKYEELKNYVLENKENSYIVFFNTKWPADNVYLKLVGNVARNNSNIIIAKKYGGKLCEVYPQNNAVTPEVMFDYLQRQIEDKKQVILLTTGASGGTGLNLGKFHGVINYELPFTSIELEQRFGRVDRMDASEDNKKEMVFILNEDINPMLRYSTLKINKTCEYMPIRNTILFYSEFIEANIKSLEIELENCSLNETEKNIFIDYHNKLSEIGENDKLVKKIIDYIMKKKDIKDFPEDIGESSKETQELIKIYFCEDYKDYVIRFYKIRDRLNKLEKEVLNWCNLLGDEIDIEEISIQSNSVYKADDSKEEYEEYEESKDFIETDLILVQEKNNGEKSDKILMDTNIIEKSQSLKEKIENLKKLSNRQAATGLFYIKDKRYYKQTVKEYRKNFRGEGNEQD